VLSLAGCVEETLVIGDERAQRACAEAPVLVLPELGCTTIQVESVSPYGCLESGIPGTSGIDHAGSWVRLSGIQRFASVRVTVLDGGALCTTDAGAAPCPATALVRAFGGTPCTCEVGTTATVPLSTTPTDIPIQSPDEDLLLEPLGARFEVSLCVTP
jgi:hypothetical protein